MRVGWKSAIAAALIVGTAGGASLAAFAGARRSATAFDRFATVTQAADILVTGQWGDGALTTSGIRALPGVAAATGGLGFAAFAADGSNIEPATIAAEDDQLARTIERPVVREGRLPNPQRDDEIFASPAGLDELHVGVGATLTLRIWPELSASTIGDLSTPENAERLRLGKVGELVTVRIVGTGLVGSTVARPERGTLTFTPAFVRKHHIGVLYGGVLVRLTPGTAVADFEERASTMLAGAQPAFQTLAGTRTTELRIVRPEVLALVAFGTLMALAAIAAASQAAVRRARETIEDDVVLNALGMPVRDRRWAESWHALGVSACAAVVTFGVAAAASLLMPLGEANRIEPSRGFDIDPLVLPLGGAALLMTTLVLGIAVPRRGSRSVSNHRTSVVGRIVRRIAVTPPMSIGSAAALEPRVGPVATAARSTLIGAVFGVGIVAVVVTFAVDLHAFTSRPSAYGWGYDVLIDTPDFSSDEGTKVLAAMHAHLDADRTVAGWGTAEVAQALTSGRRVTVVGMGTVGGTHVSATIIAGRAPVAPKEIALGTKTAAAAHVSIGDTIDLSRGANTTTFTVVGFTVLPALPTNDEDQAALGSGALIKLSAFAQLFDLPPDFSGPKIVVDLTHGTPAAAFVAGMHSDPAIAPFLDQLRISGPGLPAVPESPIAAREVLGYRDVLSTPIALAVALSTIAAASVGVALVTSVRRRRREYGTLQALGFTPGQVRRCVSWQATTVALLGAAVGIPLGVLLGHKAWIAAAHQIGIAERADVPWTFVLLAPLIAIMVANLVALYPARRAVAVSPAEALRDE